MLDSHEIETETSAPIEAPSEGTQPSEAPESNPPPEAPAGGEPTIPYSRFREVNEQKKMLQMQLEQMRQVQPQGQPSYIQPDTTPAPKQDNYQTYEEYIDARAEHTAMQATRQQLEQYARAQQSQQAQQQTQNRAGQAFQNWNSKIADAASKDPTLTNRAMEIMGDLPVELGLAVMESSATKELTNHFVQHPNDAFRLASMSPIQAGIELGALTAKLANAPAIKVSTMPRPIPPVGAGQAGGSKETGVNRALSLLYPS